MSAVPLGKGVEKKKVSILYKIHPRDALSIEIDRFSKESLSVIIPHWDFLSGQVSSQSPVLTLAASWLHPFFSPPSAFLSGAAGGHATPRHAPPHRLALLLRLAEIVAEVQVAGRFGDRWGRVWDGDILKV